MSQFLRYLRLYYSIARTMEFLAPVLDLVLRLFLANVFFKSGLTKIQTWDSTLYLFSEVYQVPFINSDVAAYVATFAELGLPVLLVLGFFGRFAAAGLFVLNLVAVISYYSGLSEAGLSHHMYWGMLLAVLLLMSRGSWSVDVWLEARLKKSD